LLIFLREKKKEYNGSLQAEKEPGSQGQQVLD
jgi:hypothetical protein